MIVRMLFQGLLGAAVILAGAAFYADLARSESPKVSGVADSGYYKPEELAGAKGDGHDVDDHRDDDRDDDDRDDDDRDDDGDRDGNDDGDDHGDRGHDDD